MACWLFFVVLFSLAAHGEVVLNEIMANGSERLLRWSATGVPTLGYGTPWQAGQFDDSTWKTGPGPFGFGSFANVSPVPVIGTNMATQMQNLTPTLYLRKTFTATATDAANPAPLSLEVQFNDGFICYLNGVEVARRNAGPTNGFVYHDQFAAFGTPANAEPSTTPYLRTQTITLGAASTLLQAGTNLLAIHVLNYWDATTLHNTATNATVNVDNVNNCYFKGDLKIAAAIPVTLVANSSSWRYLPGLVEPSGGLYDPSLLFLAKQNVRWGRASYDDTLWSTGAAPFGAGTPPTGVVLGTNLTAQIPGVSTSLYLRTVFTATAADVADPLALQLLMDWDDGFVAYLNGVEVARDRMAEVNAFTPHNAVASSARAPGTYGTYNLDPPSRLLIVGQNVLAVQVHNVTLADADLFLRAQLRTNSAGTNHTMVSPTSTWSYLVGTAEPIEAADENLEDTAEAPDASFDWVELYNNGTEAVSLANWKLSDELASPAKWAFPAGATLAAGGFLIVVCDGQNITGPASGGFYHTNFKLSSSGETLVLSDSGMMIKQLVSFGQQSAFQSYGRNADGTYVLFTEPTPGAANSGTVLTGQVAPVEFSVAAGFHPSARSVTLSCATSGASIRFTSDGSEPTETTGTAGTVVTVSGSQAIRARAFKSGMSPSITTTRTYLINEAVGRQSVPALCLVGDPQRALYRPFGVMAISGGAYPNYVAPAPTIMNGIWTQTSGVAGSGADLLAYNNPLLRGRATEKPVNMEILRADGTPGPNIGLGLRIAGSAHARPRYKLTNQNRVPGAVPAPNDGAWSATDFTQKPSFNFFFRSDFGGDPLEWPLFPNYPVSTFHDLRMRAGKNDPSNPFIEDEYMRRLFISTGQQGSRGMVNTLYVNGVYKGYYNTCEHIREDFLQRHHGGQNAWDVRQVTTIASGDGLAFQEMITFIRNNPQSSLANYQAMATRLDLVNFVDYLLTNIVSVTGDWPHNNFVCARERTVNGKHRYYMWDAEGAFGDFSGNVRTNMFAAGTTGSIITTVPSTVGFGEGIRILYTLLRASPEFKLLFADRIQKHFFNGGALTNETMLAAWNAMKAEFAPVIAPTAITDRVTPWLNGVGNPTRYTTGTTINTPSRRNVLFNGYYDDVAAGGAFVQPHFVAEGLWPATFAPVLSQNGGVVAAGYNLSISHANADGTLYFTVDGSDPREAGGTIHGTAYTAPIPINYATTIKARVRRVSGEWSPLTEAAFDTGVIEPLLITELMYHPPNNGVIDGNEYEFLEIKNPSANTIHLGGMSFSSGISYTFPPGTYIGAGRIIVLARIKARFMEKYPAVVPIGEWGSGTQLSNSGEMVTLVNANGKTVFSVNYADDTPWPIIADGSGYSLVPVNANSNPAPANPVFWRASANLGGSPGVDDPTPAVSTIVINELRANSVAPEGDRIELHNPNDFPVDISDWWLSDSDTTAQKFRIPAGTTISAGAYLCFAEADFATGAIPFGFSHNGEQARLSSGDITGSLTGYAHTVSFGASNAGVSFGRYLNSQGTELFVAQQSNTFGGVNSGPSVGPIVISELMYSPASGGDEFMELCNTSAAPVALFDHANPANGWKVDGIGWTFPGGITLRPGQVILLTQIAPADFRRKYNVAASINIYGPYSGSLNDGELIRLQQPGVPYLDALGAAVVPYIDMDQVNYDHVAPWPTSPNGGGSSLERINLRAFGDDVANWQASPANGGTLGAPSAQPLVVWLASEFTPTQRSDPRTGAWDADPDGDGLNNFREWAHGLNPWSYDSNPVITTIENLGAERCLNLSVRRSRSAAGLRVFADISPDLEEWALGGGVRTSDPVDNGDGTETVTFRNPFALGTTEHHFMRISLTSP